MQHLNAKFHNNLLLKSTYVFPDMFEFLSTRLVELKKCLIIN